MYCRINGKMENQKIRIILVLPNAPNDDQKRNSRVYFKLILFDSLELEMMLLDPGYIYYYISVHRYLK
jgi:hypothetical protein